MNDTKQKFKLSPHIFSYTTIFSFIYTAMILKFKKNISYLMIGLSIIFLSGCESSPKMVNNNENKIIENKNEKALENSKDSDMPFNIKPTKLSIFEDDTYIYYCSDEGINRVDKINRGSEIILKQTNVGQMVSSENYIYFIKNMDDNSEVFRIDKDGNNLLKVFDQNQSNNRQGNSRMIYGVQKILVIGNIIYMDSALQAYSYNMETKKLHRIVDDAYKFDVVGEHIYYIDHAERTFTIYKKNLKTMKTSIVLGEGKSYPESNIYNDFIFLKDKMYFATRNPNRLYYYNNGEAILINDKQSGLIEALTEYKGDIYYVELVNDSLPRLIKFNVKNNSTSQVAVLKDISLGWGVKIINGYAYYSTIDSVIENVKIEY